ncbi:hypothetical protein KP509_12G035900 [Ceratopteris richardii]|uniref:Serine aminopeptidase S33 domain-containing protein n=1 Tax=Ceratopteris richardii TaxID=49495 RepID=A0A8T2TR44_CERRI|nr:hypothetical protein KP509_12G035900 [Ceratopteris richardii]
MEHPCDVSTKKLSILNSSGENLAGILHDTGSKDLVILCHGLIASKDFRLLVSLAKTLSNAGLSTFRFDFSGNGESEGKFEFGNYSKEISDLHDVVLYWMQEGRLIKAILGHSKGGSTVLLYASKFKEVNMIINASGRLDLRTGLDKLFNKDFLDKIEAGPLILKNSLGNVFHVTREDLMQRLSIDVVAAVRTIPKEIRVLSVHGSEDELVDVENAIQCDSLIANHTLQIIPQHKATPTRKGGVFRLLLRFLGGRSVLLAGLCVASLTSAKEWGGG